MLHPINVDTVLPNASQAITEASEIETSKGLPERITPSQVSVHSPLSTIALKRQKLR
jgi:hypothetical protein